MAIAAQTQTPEMPRPDACCKNELLTSKKSMPVVPLAVDAASDDAEAADVIVDDGGSAVVMVSVIAAAAVVSSILTHFFHLLRR